MTKYEFWFKVIAILAITAVLIGWQIVQPGAWK